MSLYSSKSLQFKGRGQDEVFYYFMLSHRYNLFLTVNGILNIWKENFCVFLDAFLVDNHFQGDNIVNNVKNMSSKGEKYNPMALLQMVFIA